jgi:phosphatidate cytidylyltransferase
MLKQRILTAVILIPLVLAGILFLPTSALAAIFGVFVLQGSWEWSKLAGLQHVIQRTAYVFITAISLLFAWKGMNNSLSVSQVFYIALFWWAVALVWVFNPALCKAHHLVARSIKLLAGLLVLIPAWLAVVFLHQSGPLGPQYLIYGLALAWVADSGAYFAGKRWGRHKLAPSVSPGKTIEGALGAVVLVLLYAILSSFYFELQGQVRTSFIILGLILVPVSILGDLFESLLKRHSGFKDSGTLLPGHGGVMDRIDSLTAILPLYALGMLFMGLA